MEGNSKVCIFVGGTSTSVCRRGSSYRFARELPNAARAFRWCGHRSMLSNHGPPPSSCLAIFVRAISVQWWHGTTAHHGDVERQLCQLEFFSPLASPISMWDSLRRLQLQQYQPRILGGWKNCNHFPQIQKCHWNATSLPPAACFVRPWRLWQMHFSTSCSVSLPARWVVTLDEKSAGWFSRETNFVVKFGIGGDIFGWASIRRWFSETCQHDYCTTVGYYWTVSCLQDEDWFPFFLDLSRWARVRFVWRMPF